jgi:hypothetical protein
MINMKKLFFWRKRTVYLAQDRTDNNKQLHGRLIWWGIPMFILISIVLAVFIRDLGTRDQALRSEWLTSLLSVLAGALGIFTFGMFISPVLSYRRHLHYVLDGRKREVRGTLKKIDNVPVMRDGVRFYPVTISAGDLKDEADDRLLYYDANKPLPGWREGQLLSVFAHDKTIAAYTAAE